VPSRCYARNRLPLAEDPCYPVFMLKFPRWFQLLGLGALITLTQIIFMVLNGPSGASLTERYLRLNQWDSLQYRIIAEEGYRIPEDRPHAITSEDIHSYRANVVFFPGLPMMARGLSKLTSVLMRSC